ncbi:MAG TPA: hypothetical protein VGQ02_11775 [Candidatus Limnocylindrales bacterium]|nr:hypothetical protein [Candidatus Limnocylindrales bacterium]
MRGKLISLGVVGQLAMALFITASSVSGAGSVFAGTWVSIDFDGSTQALVVSGGTSPRVTFEDFYASSCDLNGSPATHWVSAGQGTVDGNTMSVDFHKSGCGVFSIGAYSDVWFYDPATDTLTDSVGITWSRFH